MSGKVVHVNGGLPYDIYIGRAMPRSGLKASKWANPVKVDHNGLEWALLWYERMIMEHLDTPGFREELAEVRGKTLACWCPGKCGDYLTTDDEEICHGQILLRLAEELTA
jgi:hypothetical protein